MNAHLTGNSQSIPIVILLNDHLQFLASWGPRPKAAQEVVLRLKSDPATANSYQESLHSWYTRDKQQSIQEEIGYFIAA